MSEKYMETCFSSYVVGGSPAVKSYIETRLKFQAKFYIFDT